MTSCHALQPLQHTRILSLALNLPGPAALLRCAQMGAECTKLEPLPASGQTSADPMEAYSPQAYAAMHVGVRVLSAHLKTEPGQAALHAELARSHSGHGVCLDVALAGAAQWLALPRQWGLTLPQGDVGGAHAGYRIYDCADGRVAMAALEPHFALRLCEAAGIPLTENAPTSASAVTDLLRAPATHAHIAIFVRTQTRAALEALATAHDIPLHTLA